MQALANVTVRRVAVERAHQRATFFSSVNVRTAGGDFVFEEAIGGRHFGEGFAQSLAERVHPASQRLPLDVPVTVVTYAPALVAVVVPGLSVMIDVGHYGRRVGLLCVLVEKQSEIDPLVGSPSQDLLTHAGVNRRRGSPRS